LGGTQGGPCVSEQKADIMCVKNGKISSDMGKFCENLEIWF
jgi:hypothetical protein